MKRKTISYGLEKHLLELAIGMKSLYIWESGTIQLSELLIIFLLGILFVKYRFSIIINKKILRWLYLFGGLVLYTMLINVLWSIVCASKGYSNIIIKPTAFYLFELLISFTIILMNNLIGTKALEHVLINGFFYASIITAVGCVQSVIIGNGRTTAFFNNPNQLGLFAVVLITFVIYEKKNISRYKKTFMFLIGIIANLLSLSKAGIISVVVLVIFNILWLSNEKKSIILFKRLFALLIALSTIYLVFFSSSELVLNNNILFKVRIRIVNMMDEPDSSLGEGRGYNRVLEMGQHILYGMGEGNFTRFHSLSGGEVHSLYVNFFVSYGIIGMIILIALVFRCFSYGKTFWNDLILFSGILLFGITHNCIRNTLIWILLAIMLVKKYSEKEYIQNVSRNEIMEK